MSIFKNFDWSIKSIAKVVGAIFLGIVMLSVAISLISFSFNTIFSGSSSNNRGYNQAYDMDDGYGMEESEMGFSSAPMSMKSISMPYPEPGFSTGGDAEDFEVKNYSGTIQTAKLDKTCDKIASLKVKDYVIFENSNKNDESCYYSFKVNKVNEEEIVKVIEDLDPETFNANIQSIKKSVEGISNELDILTKKLNSIEDTLENAQESYDEISKLATRQQDAETLAKIIDNKLRLIEKLTNERLNIKAQIDRYNKSKADQLDRLNYTFFNINVYKDVIVDWKNIKDSWKYEAKALIDNINDAFQQVTLNLVVYLVRFAQIVLYLFISVFLLKFVWFGIKKIWKVEFKKGRRK